MFSHWHNGYDMEPTFKSNLLVYGGRFYIVGDGHKEFAAEKMQDQDYYVLTLDAIAWELNIRKMAAARVHMAVGLPLTWVGEQKESFKAYLLQKDMVEFTFRNMGYLVEFSGADVYPQGFSAVADRLREFRGVNMLCDIGNGTMNLMYINNGRPVPSKCYTEKFGTHQCMLLAREMLMQKFGTAVDDTVVEEVLWHGKADISQRYLDVIRETASEYVCGIMRRLREPEYNPELMRLYFMGGGSCLIRHFGKYDPNRVIINDDICATAKGYERLAENALRKNGELS